MPRAPAAGGAVGAWRLGLVSFLLSASCAWPPEVPGGSPSNMVRQAIEGPAPEVVLVDQSSQPFALRNLRGKAVLLTFIYSACADVCPLITATMTMLQQRLAAGERTDVFFLSVTVEPGLCRKFSSAVIDGMISLRGRWW